VSGVSTFVVVERELMRLGRRWQTMAARAGFAAIVFAFVSVACGAQYALSDFLSVASLAKVGRAVFVTWTGSLFAAVGLVTPVLVGQAVIDEKESRTLELLAMTRLTPRRILWGTLLSRLLMIESLMLGATPVLAVVLGFGGVGPLEMLNALLQANVTMLVTGAVATFLALYARSVIVVALQTWGWWFVVHMVIGVLAAFGALGGTNFAFGTPGGALAGMSVQMGLSPWLALIVPPAMWGTVAFVVMHLASLCFDTLALAEKEPDEGDADLAAGFWPLEAFRKRLWPAFFLLLFLSPVLVANRLLGALVPVLPELLSWVWFTAAVALSSVVHLLGTRRSALKQASKARQRTSRVTSWKRMASFYEETDREDAQAARRGVARGRAKSPENRRVWADPVAWRETVTSAHGRVRRALVLWYVGFGIIVGLTVAFGGLGEPTALTVLGSCILAVVPLLTLLLATSSVVGERTAGTLELLCVTPLGGARIVRGKLAAMGVLLGPGVAVGAALVMIGALGRGGLDPLDAAGGLVWGFVVNLVVALLSMWRAMSAKIPSRAWAANLALVVGFWWLIAGVTGVPSLAKPLAPLWAVIVPFALPSGGGGRLLAMLVVSSVFWGVVALGLALGLSRAMTRRAAGT
jgi:ABC-type transport system involved in multi-copper enzyme maturation permease subunit